MAELVWDGVAKLLRDATKLLTEGGASTLLRVWMAISCGEMGG